MDIKKSIGLIVLGVVTNVLIAQNKTHTLRNNFEKKLQSLAVNTDTKKSILIALDQKKEVVASCQAEKKRKKATQSILFSPDLLNCNRVADIGFRKKLNQLLSLEQFGQLFADELHADIETKLLIIYKDIIKPYNFNTKQLDDLKQLVTKQLTLEVNTFAYYRFNIPLAKALASVVRAAANIAYYNQLYSYNNQQIIYINTDSKLEGLIERAKKAQISISKINTITKYYLETVLEEKKVSRDFEIWKQDSVVYVYDNNYNKKTINNAFKRKLAELLSIKEYALLFEKTLEARIERAKAKKWREFKNAYVFKETNIDRLKKITDYYAIQEELIGAYFAYDFKKRHLEITALKDTEKEHYQNALKQIEGNTQNINKSNNKRLTYFVERAKKAGVAASVIDQLLEAIKTQEQEIKAQKKRFKNWKDKYIVYFHDSKKGPEVARLKLKKRLSELLTIDQFKSMFMPSLQEKANRQITDRLSTIKQTYPELKPLQFKTLETMIKEQVIAETVTYAYYSYEHKLAIQKVRAMQYKFDRKYKTQLLTFTQN